MNTRNYNRISFLIVCFVIFFSSVGYSDSLKDTQLKIIEKIQGEVSSGNSINTTGVSFVRRIMGKNGTLIAEFRGAKNESIEISFESSNVLSITINFSVENKYLLPLISKAMASYISSDGSPPLRLSYSVLP